MTETEAHERAVALITASLNGEEDLFATFCEDFGPDARKVMEYLASIAVFFLRSQTHEPIDLKSGKSPDRARQLLQDYAQVTRPAVMQSDETDDDDGSL